MKARSENLASRRKLAYWGNELLFVGPIFIAFLVVKIIPLFMTAGYALTEWNGISTVIEFCGMDNFARLFQDGQFWSSMWFTIRFSVLTVLVSNVLGFFLAYALSKPIKFRNLMRAGFYLPNTLGGLVLGFVWNFVFLSVFPKVFDVTKIPFFGLAWTGTPATSFWAMVIVQSWVLSGYLMLLYIAGLSTVPADCVESATIDGARPRQILWHVTVPLIMPTVTRCLFLSILTSMRVYEINLALTEGGPFRSSESITMNVYNSAFVDNLLGYGSAKAFMFILVVVLISGLQVWFTSRKEVQA